MTHKSKIFIQTSVISLTVALTACVTTDRDRPNFPVAEICKEYCKEKPKEIFAVMDTRWDEDDNKLTSMPQGSFYINTPDGGMMTPSKAEGLDPDCFAERSFISPGAKPEAIKANDLAPDLADKDLTWDNTSIIFINFNKDGRLESWELKQQQATKSGSVYGDLDAALGSGAQSINSEYEHVRDLLSNLDTPAFSNTSGSPNYGPGRPRSDFISAEGFEARNLNSVPHEKTPFFKKLPAVNGKGVKDHVFFYVLLDENLKFDRNGAHLPYSAAANNALGQLYTPYIQYPIAPDDLSTKKDKVEVMPVHFYRGGNMATKFDEKRNPRKRCVYPYDIGVIADGQQGFKQKTPLRIDPEVEADGVPHL